MMSDTNRALVLIESLVPIAVVVRGLELADRLLHAEEVIPYDESQYQQERKEILSKIKRYGNPPASIYIDLGWNEYKLQLFEDAREHLNAGIHLLYQELEDLTRKGQSPNEKFKKTLAIGLNNLAITEDKLGNVERAEELLHEALRWNNKLTWMYVNLGEINFTRGQFQSALEYVREARKLDFYDRNAVATAALCFDALGEEENAIKLWAWLLKQDSRFAHPSWFRREFNWDYVYVEAARTLITKLNARGS